MTNKEIIQVAERWVQYKANYRYLSYKDTDLTIGPYTFITECEGFSCFQLDKDLEILADAYIAKFSHPEKDGV